MLVFAQMTKNDAKPLEKFAIFIPAYNAAKTLPNVLDRIPIEIRNQVEEIMVIDNHSSDNTDIVAMTCKQDKNIYNMQVIRNPQNMGYGGSQKIAYKRCIQHGNAGVVMLHGDAQYAPELMGDLLKPILEGKADMVFGSRMTGNAKKDGTPFHRYYGNKLLTWLQNKFLGTNLSEFHSGYRIFSVEALKKVPFHRLSSDYHFDTEIIILFVDQKLRISEVFIPKYYGEEENYVNIWKYTLDVLVTTVSYFLHKRKIRKSRNWSRILAEPKMPEAEESVRSN